MISDTSDASSSSSSASIKTAGGLAVAKSLHVGTSLSAEGDVTLGNAATDLLTIGATIQGSGLVFEGQTQNNFELTLQVTDPTNDNVIVLPDASGTIIVDQTSITQLSSSVQISTSGSASFTGTFAATGSSLTLGDSTSADLLTIGATIQGSSPLVFEGSTADAHETTVAVADPTADRTITLPDNSGTILLTSTTNTISTLASDVSISTSGSIATTGAFSATGSSITLGNGASDLITIGGVFQGANILVCEGQTADDHETTIAIVDPTADRVISLPDATGTVLLSSTTTSISTLAPDVVISTSGAISTTSTLTASGNTVIGSDSSDTLTVSATLLGASPLIFEGGTSDGNELVLAVASLGADRTVTLPDATGTFILDSTTSTISTVGALATGSIANGFGTIQTGNVIETTSTIKAGTGLTIGGSASSGAKDLTVQSSDNVVSLKVKTLSSSRSSTVELTSGAGGNAQVTLLETGGSTFHLRNDAAANDFKLVDGSSNNLLSVASTTGNAVLLGSLTIGSGSVLSSSGLTGATTVEASTSISVGGSSSSGAKSLSVRSSDEVVSLEVRTETATKTSTVLIKSGAGADAKVSLQENGGDVFHIINDATASVLTINDGSSDLLKISPSTGNTVITGTLTVNGGPVISSSGISGLSSITTSSTIGVTNGPQLTTSGIDSAEVIAGVTSLTLSAGPALSSSGIASAGAITGCSSLAVSSGPTLSSSGISTA